MRFKVAAYHCFHSFLRMLRNSRLIIWRLFGVRIPRKMSVQFDPTTVLLARALEETLTETDGRALEIGIGQGRWSDFVWPKLPISVALLCRLMGSIVCHPVWQAADVSSLGFKKSLSPTGTLSMRLRIPGFGFISGLKNGRFQASSMSFSIACPCWKLIPWTYWV